ncbi:MAG: PAS-domain containing protein, partial [Alphaproteobacteria bacterium]
MSKARTGDGGGSAGMAAFGSVVENIVEGVMQFDADDRLVVCNAAAHAFFSPIDKSLKTGARFDDVVGAMAGKAVVGVDGQGTDDWLEGRIERHKNPNGAFDDKLIDGRWVRVSESPDGDGGMIVFYTDITGQKLREIKAREGEQHYQDLNDIGVALSSEKDVNQLLEMILLEAKNIANADGGTIYLYDFEEPGEWTTDKRIDRRAGGDRRSGYDRRSHLDACQSTASDPKPDTQTRRSDRRSGVDRRRRPDILKFAIMRTDTLNIAMGGTTGKDIPFPPLRIYDAVSGEGNYKNVATLVALTGETVNIPDAYTSDEFDFSGTKAFDANTGYRSMSFLTMPMKNKKDEVIGVVQLLNARDRDTGAIIPFDANDQMVIESLASQAAVALDNQMLIEGQRKLLDSFIQLIAGAIDEKSPYTGGHCERVPMLTEMLAAAACEASEGKFKDFQLNSEEMYELHIAGWMHDCGKVTTPEHVVDKSTKLETIYDRIETVVTRFEIIKRDAELAYLRDVANNDIDAAASKAEFDAQIAQLVSDWEFIVEANVGGEFMDDDKKDRVRSIAEMRWRGPDGEDKPFLDDDEVYNLCIGRGTLTEEERKVINDHIVVTIEMLEKLPFPKGLTRVPEYAGGH